MPNSTLSEETKKITVRKGPRAVAPDPKRAFQGSILQSHFFHAMSLLFPKGEQFFIDHVRKWIDSAPPGLKAEAKAFAGQEAMHSKAHTLWNDALAEHGYDVSNVEELLDLLLSGDFIDRLHPKLGLSITAALEHVTATQSAWFLRHPEFTERLSPELRELTLWHSCEEIEHKHVAFDLLKHVDDSYSLRIAGHLLGQILLWGGAFYGLGLILSQEKELSFAEAIDDLRRNRAGFSTFAFNNVVRFIEYFRPDFHPDDDDSRGLAREWLAKLEVA